MGCTIQSKPKQRIPTLTINHSLIAETVQLKLKMTKKKFYKRIPCLSQINESTIISRRSLQEKTPGLGSLNNNNEFEKRIV